MTKKKKPNTHKEVSMALQKANDLFPSDPKEKKALEKIYALLLNFSRVDFSKYRDTTVLRRLNRRMNLCSHDNYTDYLNFLKKNDSGIYQLFNDLLLSFTQFFRDENAFDTLKKEVFPNLVKNRPPSKTIRIWVPGCSTGEEVYSIAICLYEFMDDNNIKVPVKIFGTDLLEQHISKARSAIYADKIKEYVSKDRIERFFEKTLEGFIISKHIREWCVFATQDITQDPPFPNIDLVSCRNVLIYFSPEYQDAAIPRFHFSLIPEGFLLLGSSETMGKFPELFSIVDRKSNLFSKRHYSNKSIYHFPFTQRATKIKLPVANAPGSSAGSKSQAQESAQINKLLLDAYVPPGVIIDSNLQIHQFIGNTHPYLTPASGEASLKLPRMAGDTLMPDIYVALEEAKKKKDLIRKKHVSYEQNGRFITTDLCVIPVLEPNSKDSNYLILFEEPETPPADSPPPSKKSGKAHAEVERLNQELQQTKEHLQAIIEEKIDVNQELWAANEEIMSTNEELQSVNEEMEASKEELESGNEELLALNEEMRIKNLSIAESEEDQRLLFQNIHAGIVVHAPDTSILVANNRACEILGLTLDQMMGKTAVDPAWCFFRKEGCPMPLAEYPVNQVIAKLKPISFFNVGINRPQTNDVVWVLVHAFPEMEPGGALRQVIVTFVDITKNMQTEQALRESERKNRTWIENSPVCTIIVDLDYNLQFMSESGIKGFNIDDINEFYGKPYPFDFYPDSFKTPMRENLKKAKTTGETITQEASVVDLIGNELWYHSTIAPVNDEHGNLDYLMVVSLETTDQKQAEEDLKKSEKKFRSYVRSAPFGIFVVDEQGHYLDVNPTASAITGYSTKELLSMQISDLLPPQALSTGERHFKTVVSEGHVSGENLFRHKSGEIRHWIVDAVRLSPTKFMGYVQDITDRKRSEEMLEKRLVALTLPLNDPKGLSFEEMFNLADIQRLQDEFANATGVASIITHPDGTPITKPSNFCRLCNDIIRKTDKGQSNCYKSDAALGSPNPEGPVVQPCLSGGLWDAGASISVGGQHIANWLIGQVRDETQTDEHMRAYAREIGADEETVSQAFSEVPAMSREKFGAISHALFTLANQLSDMAYQNVQQARFITEREQAEDALIKSEEQLKVINENIADIILQSDSAGHITYVNRALPGLPYEKIIGSTVFDFVPPDQRPVVRSALATVFEKGKTVSYESLGPGPNGESRNYDVKVSPIFSGDKIVSAVFLASDITTRKQAEAEHEKLQAQLTQAQKMEAVGRLAGGVAHDFNNMLSVILGHAEMTLENITPDQPFYTNLSEIKEAAERSADLTRQLLAFARKQTVAPKVLDINQTVESMTSMLRRLIGEDIELAFLPGEHLWSVRIDPVQVDQILANLCVNAQDAIAGVGKISIETDNISLDETYCSDHAETIPGDYVMLAVSDDGCGMDAESTDNIFEPFFTTKEQGKGTGLGLATVYGVVKQNNGLINVYSEPGQGTTIKIYLPRHSSKTVRTGERKLTVAPQGNETILLVEDEPMILDVSTLMLEGEGYTVVGADSPGKAIRLAREYNGKIDLLMSDVVMPEMNGRDLARNILSLYPDIKSLFMSGYTAEIIAHQGVLEEGVNFIQKPFSRLTLTTKVREVLNQDSCC